MQRGMTGRFEVTAVGGERVQAFVPAALPPRPPIEMDHGRQRLLENALLACGRLDAITALLPEPDLFLYAYVRREAVLSSQIEGTQSSLSDLTALRTRGGAGRALRRRGGGLQLRGGPGAWTCSSGRGLSAVQSADPGDSRATPFSRAGRGQAAGRVSHQPELDRRDSSRQCSVCSSTPAGGGAVHGRARAVHA